MLIVTFTRAMGGRDQVRDGGDWAPPGLLQVEVGSADRTEVLEPASEGPAVGSLTAAATENVVRLKATAACWFAIGAEPAPVAGECRHLDAGEVAQFLIAPGERVAAIAAGDG